mmetsp:Transcript_5766/g.5226  ORF Transcript_5766/g.5226 Transcript_5766/m.5226 type:complete len:197 (-) Transcript_5766:2492-3082(-)
MPQSLHEFLSEGSVLLFAPFLCAYSRLEGIIVGSMALPAFSGSEVLVVQRILESINVSIHLLLELTVFEIPVTPKLLLKIIHVHVVVEFLLLVGRIHRWLVIWLLHRRRPFLLILIVLIVVLWLWMHGRSTMVVVTHHLLLLPHVELGRVYLQGWTGAIGRNIHISHLRILGESQHREHFLSMSQFMLQLIRSDEL